MNHKTNRFIRLTILYVASIGCLGVIGIPALKWAYDVVEPNDTNVLSATATVGIIFVIISYQYYRHATGRKHSTKDNQILGTGGDSDSGGAWIKLRFIRRRDKQTTGDR